MRRLRHLIWVPLALPAEPAFAHSPLPGIDGFYTGILHPFSTPAQALVIVSLGLLVSTFAVEKARWPLAAFVLTSLGTLLLGTGGAELNVPMFVIALTACALVALCPGHFAVAAVGLVAAGGLSVSLVSIPDAGPATDRIITMSGAFVGATLGLLYVFGAVHFVLERYKAPWVALAMRIAAAWLGAVALLMVALRFAAAPVVL